MNNVTQAPPLDLDLSKVDISMPLLADGTYDFVCEKAEQKATKDGKGSMISLDYKTLNPAKARDGSDLGAGIHVFDNCMVVPTGKGTWDMVARNAGAIIQGARPAMPPGCNLQNVAQWAPQLVGKTFRLKIGYAPAGTSKDGKAFKEKNTVELYVTKW